MKRDVGNLHIQSIQQMIRSIVDAGNVDKAIDDLDKIREKKEGDHEK